MNIQNVDIVGAKLLERVLNGDVQGFHVVPREVDLQLHVVRPTLVVRSVLDGAERATHISDAPLQSTEQHTLVAITIWWRIPRFSIHSPINSSEVSS